jgi:hypothetical protein
MANLDDLKCGVLGREFEKFEVGSRTRLYDLQTNAEHSIAPTGAFETAELIRLIGGNFESGALPTVTWETAVTGSGTVTAVTGELIMSTGVTANSIAEVQSANRAEFTTATFNKAHLAFQMDNFTNADVIREFGMFDPVTPIVSGDGVFFRNDGGTFSVVRRKGGADVAEVFVADFNGGNMFTEDNNIHIYELVYNAGVILFMQDRKILHRMTSLDTVAYETTHLTLGARIENENGNTVDNTLESRGFSCSRIGTSSAAPDSITLNTPSTGLLKNSPGELASVIINDSGAAGATLELYDDVAAVGTPIVSLDLTAGLVALEYNRRLNNGLFFDVSGNGFEVVVNWR